MKKLSDMQRGATGTILEIEHKALEIALMRLGLVTGDRFEVADIAPMGGPMAINVDGTKVAMRRSDAANVKVKTD